MKYFSILRWLRSHCFQLFPWFVFVVVTSATAIFAPAAMATSITLDQVAQRVIHQHPELTQFYWRQQAISAQRNTAALSQPVAVTLGAENLLGSGDFSGIDSAELMVALSSVIELGNKAKLRVTEVDRQLAAEEAQKRAFLYDVLGQATQVYIALLTQQQQIELFERQVEFFELNVERTLQRVERGVAPQADWLRAKSELAQSQLELIEHRARYRNTQSTLASLWGSTDIDFDRVEGELYLSREIEPFDTLVERMASSPFIDALTAQVRLQQAKSDVANAQASADIHWRAGITQHLETDDTSIGVSVSIPLFLADRNRSVSVAYEAREAEALSARHSALSALRAELYSAYQLRAFYYTALQSLRAEIVPLRRETLEATRLAYESGHYSYSDWLKAQRDLFAAQAAMIEAASGVLSQHSKAEQLSGQVLYAATSKSSSAGPNGDDTND